MNTHKIDILNDAAQDAYQQVIALELATGCSLPNDIGHWPNGLRLAWNDAADAGAFDEAKTLGDMARAFLRHRLLNVVIDPEPVATGSKGGAA